MIAIISPLFSVLVFKWLSEAINASMISSNCDGSNYIIGLNIGSYCGRIWICHVVGWAGVLSIWSIWRKVVFYVVEEITNDRILAS
ncbi:hypothetical protein CKY02_08690 [Photorhabdus bodei]|uniref:Uncharacterized protein n=2 Tax=Photorhabdus bodei TaxID=2029681 RepID=A0A329X8A8_9GAMM|nr:hypothetical protein CKY02_08690 [Photorhabdus bodei]